MPAPSALGLDQRDAYRFAKGEEVMASSGQPAKLSRPLDFLVVADHSDNMGFFPDLLAGKPEVLADPTGRKWYDMIQSGKGAAAAIDIIIAFGAGQVPRDRSSIRPDSDAYRSAWQETIKAAEEANDPGRFTAFIGYEWTSNTGGNNLHRNVIFRDNGDKASQVVPYTTLPPSAATIRATCGNGCRPMRTRPAATCWRIAHNGNLSNGRMFPMIESFTGKPIDREYAETRAKWERLYEATQIKGDGETHPFLSPNDEFANFERWDKGNLDLHRRQDAGHARVRICALGPEERAQARSRSSGVNPYKFGMVGSTDAHTGLAARRGGQFLRQDVEQRAEPGARDASVHEDRQIG